MNFNLAYRDFDNLAVGLVLGMFLIFLLCKVHRRGKQGRRIAGLIGSMMSLVVIACLYLSFSGQQNLRISEVGSNNQTIVLDELGTIADYVELYNAGSLVNDTFALYLSDDPDDLKKFEVPGAEIPAYGYHVIPLTDGTLGLNKNGGETLFLSDSAGTVLDKIELADVKNDMAYVRMEGSVGEDPVWEVRTASPGLSNEHSYNNVETPVFSVEGGFYPSEFQLELQAEAGEIYYTLGGSIPTVDSHRYEGPIRVYNRSQEPNQYRSVNNVTLNWAENQLGTEPVDKAFVVRAVAVDEHGRYSDVATASYFVELEQYQNKPVISLVADPQALFGDNGIYVTGKEYDDWYLGGQNGEAPMANFQKKGREYEIPISFEMLNQEQYLNQEAGLRIFGSSSRQIVLKRLSVYARKEYGDSYSFDQELFDGTDSHSILLRSGFPNAFSAYLAKDRHAAAQDSYPVTVFINGELWEETILMEKYDSLYFSEHYNIDRDNLIVIKDGQISEGVESDWPFYEEIYHFMRDNDLSDPENYQKCMELMDLQSYIDYMCYNIYLQNMDYGDVKNTIIYRSRESRDGEYEDGRWRWALYDMDCVAWKDPQVHGVEELYMVNTFAAQPLYVDVPINQQAYFKALKVNDDFCRRFVLTFMDLVNTRFSMDYVYKEMEAFGEYSEYMAEFLANRPQYIVPFMAQEFGLTGSLQPVTISVNDAAGGTVVLNTITPELTNNSWSGNYYTDYPVTAEAVPADGYVFAGWSGSVTSDQACIDAAVSEGGITLHAIFEKQSE